MRLFISYAHVDRYLVEQLVKILRSGGHDPWFDPALLPGQDWKQTLLDAITRCDAFLYALTPESVASEWCQWEFARAVEMGKSIIPVMLQEKTDQHPDFPDLLRRYQWADFSAGPTPEATAKLMGGLTQIMITVPREEALPAPSDPGGVPAQAESPGAPVYAVKESPITAKTDAEERRLEAAMPQQTKVGMKTELWVKISIPGSEGLRGELPAVVRSGDIIHKGDVRASTFPIAFPRDDRTGVLLPANLCLKVLCEDFVAQSEIDRHDICPEAQVPVELPPHTDSRTIIFELLPMK